MAASHWRVDTAAGWLGDFGGSERALGKLGVQRVTRGLDERLRAPVRHPKSQSDLL